MSVTWGLYGARLTVAAGHHQPRRSLNTTALYCTVAEDRTHNRLSRESNGLAHYTTRPQSVVVVVVQQSLTA